MLRTEVLEIIANGENSGVEFKRDSIKPEEFARETVAFANFQGGRILLGVEDDGSISGLRRSNTQEWVLNAFKDKIHPQIIPFYEELDLGNKQKIAVVSVSSGISKPYVCIHNRREDMYIRIGNRTELAAANTPV
jgi:ATP-dependent DNA helicase RecG